MIEIDDQFFDVTIFPARYSGAYEGGEWVAVNQEYCSIPIDPVDDDVSAFTWYTETKTIWASGNTPQEAYEKLVIQIKERHENFRD